PGRALVALRSGAVVLDPRGGPVRDAVADHPDHERRPAGAAAGPDDTDDHGLRADHVHRRDRAGPAPRRAAVGTAVGGDPDTRRDRDADHHAHAAAVPAHPDATGPDQPRAAGAD